MPESPDIIDHLDAIVDADDARIRAIEGLTNAVLRARAEGATWQDIGEVLGITKQAAHQRWCSRLDALDDDAVDCERPDTMFG